METKPTILVVDDLEENIYLIQQFLRIEGYQIRSATSGEDALKSIAENPPDLVLLDVMMPGMDGLEVCRRIKRSANNFLPVVLVTAYGASEIKRKGLEAGAEEFISKPYEPEELIARIRSLMRTKRLYNELKDANRVMEDELEAVGELQRSLLPSRSPIAPQLRVRSFYLPSRPAGGDYFDYFYPGGDRVGIAIGDASGHGPPAAVLMAITKTTLHLARRFWDRPAELLTEAGRELAAFVPAGQFTTLLYGIIDFAKKEIVCASAGHCPPIVMRASGADPEILKVPTGLPLGIDADHRFEQAAFPFGPGDSLLLYTDGLTEAQNAEFEMFGMSRLMEMAPTLKAASAEGLGEAILRGASAFTGEQGFRDDCTVLLLEYRGSAD